MYTDAMKQWHRSRSFFEASAFAWRGLADAFHREQNVRTQMLFGAIVVCAMIFLRVPIERMAILIFAITLVLVLEMLNSSLELLSDVLHPEYSQAIKSSKDIAAGAVLLASIAAVAIGLLVFIPAIAALL